jgi:sialic acid synthase SpsE
MIIYSKDKSYTKFYREIIDLCSSSKITKLALGAVNYAPLEAEKLSIEHRRSLYFVKDLSKGQLVDEKCVRSIRPGNGLKPKYLHKVIGQRAARDIKFGTPVSFADLLSSID